MGERKSLRFTPNATESGQSWPIVVSAFECPIRLTDTPKPARDVIFSTQTRGLLSVSEFSNNFYEGIGVNEWESSGCFCAFFHQSTNDNFNGLVKLAASVLGKDQPLRFCSRYERTGKVLRMKTEVNKIWLDVEARCPTTVGKMDDPKFDRGAMIYVEELEEYTMTEEERRIYEERVQRAASAGRGSVDTVFTALLVSAMAVIVMLYSAMLTMIGKRMRRQDKEECAKLIGEERKQRKLEQQKLALEVIDSSSTLRTDSRLGTWNDTSASAIAVHASTKTPPEPAETVETAEPVEQPDVVTRACAEIVRPPEVSRNPKIHALRHAMQKRSKWQKVLVLSSVQMFGLGLCFTSVAPVMFQSKCTKGSGGTSTQGCNIFDSDIGEAIAYVSVSTAVGRAIRFFTRPFFGRLSDVAGRRPVILMSFFSNLLTLGLLLIWPTRAGLIASFLASSFLDANTTVFFAIVTDIGPSHDRVEVRGYRFREKVANARARLWTTLLAFLGLGAGFGLVSNIMFNIMMRLMLPQVSACRVPLAASCIMLSINLGLAYRYFPETLEKQELKNDEMNNAKMALKKDVEDVRFRGRTSSQGVETKEEKQANGAHSLGRWAGCVRGLVRFVDNLLGPIKFLMRNAQTRTYALVLAFFNLGSVFVIALPWWSDLRFHWRELDFALFGCALVAIGLLVYGVIGPCLLKRDSMEKVSRVAIPMGCIFPIFFGLAWKPWMWYAAGILSGTGLLAEPLMIATMSSSFSEAEQGEFSGAYQSIKGLTKIVSPFIIMGLFNWSVEGYDCETDGLQFRPATGAIFYYSAAMLSVGGVIFCYRYYKDNTGRDLDLRESSMNGEDVEECGRELAEEDTSATELVAVEMVHF